MKRLQLLLLVCIFTVLLVVSGVAFAATLRVPKDFSTIQAAVDAASSGDKIRVGPGEWCGATIDIRVDLFGEGGATIIGCDSNPALASVLRIGFFLPDGSASGTTIRHFVFDGQGVSNANFDPLSFAVFARDADNVIVEQNRILETVQGITNTSGSDWTVSHNVIEDLTLFACDNGFCGGGVAIVFQERSTSGPRQMDNSATFNVITGVIPDNFDVFSMAGIFIAGQDGTVAKNNRIAIPDNPTSDALGLAILVSDVCCANDIFLTSKNSVIVKNDGRESEFSVVIDLDNGGGTGNSEGTTLRGNFGINDINGTSTDVKNRSIMTLVTF